MRRFEFKEGGSSKFWEIQVDGSDQTVRFGRIGAAGATTTKAFGSAAEAQKAADKLIQEKTKKGYIEATAGRAPPVAPAKKPAPARGPDSPPALPALQAPPGHLIPPLLEAFAQWFDQRPGERIVESPRYLGSLEVKIGVPYWDDTSAARLKRDGFSFIETGDGSQLVLLKTGAKSPPAVCLLGSEGATATVANSLEEFLELLAAGETGVMDLDVDEARGRKRLKAWLSKNKVKTPLAAGFDFAAYLDGKSGAVVKAPAAAAVGAGPMPEAIAKLSPILQKVAMIVGRRADDPAVIQFIAGELGKKVPDSVSAIDGKHVVDKKRGLEFLFSHEIINENYPLLQKTKNSFVPYLELVWLTKELDDVLPYGLKFGMTEQDIQRVLGPTKLGRGYPDPTPYWAITLDPQRDVIMDIDYDYKINFRMTIAQASDIRPSHGDQERVVTGLLVAWAALRGVLNESKFGAHAELIAAIRRREKQGSALVVAALPRGLWDIHIKDLPGLRTYMREWVFNMGKWIDDDMKKALKWKPKSALDDLIIADDDWATMAKIIPVFDKQFAKWIKK